MNHAAPNTRKLMKQVDAALQKQRGQEAMNLLEQVVALNPHHAEAWYKIGFILHSGANHRAREFYERALAEDPTHFQSYVMLCTLLESEDRAGDAMNLASHVAKHVLPHNPDAHALLVSLLLRHRQSHLALPYLEAVLPQFPDHLELHQHYCMALKLTNQHDRALEEYTKLNQSSRLPAAFRINFASFMPRLNNSAEEIDRQRAALSEAIDGFIAEKPSVEHSSINYSPVFSLAFHNRDNRELLARYTKMLRTVAPSLNYEAKHVRMPRREGPVRLAFISAHMHLHSVGSCYRRLLIDMAKRPEFEVRFFNYTQIMDAGIQEIVDANIPMQILPRSLGGARQLVESFEPDIIVYPDIGMHVNTHYLAMSRLAKHQCFLIGHPETTGIDTLDYAICSRSYEPENADENYGEQLLCSEGVDTVFMRPHAPERWLTRAELGLPEGKKLYVCPMAIQKFHPDFDRVLADILTRDPDAVLVLFRDFHQEAATDLLHRRILGQCDPQRVIFLPWQPHEVLFSILKACDAVLDTIYFGGGTTAQYAFAFGVPIVTFPGRWARGRVVHSYYTVMGIENPPEATSLASYAEVAIKLANDREYYRFLEKQILENNAKLFEQGAYGPHFAKLLLDIMQQHLEPYRRIAGAEA